MSGAQKKLAADPADLNAIALSLENLAMRANMMSKPALRLALIDLELRVRRAVPLLMKVPVS